MKSRIEQLERDCKVFAWILLLVAAILFPVLRAQQPAKVLLVAPKNHAERDSRIPDSDRPLITIPGFCTHSVKADSPECTTVITRGQFEGIIHSLDPQMPQHARLEFAEQYAEALVMADRAEQLGLDKGADFQERIKLARIEILSQILKKQILEESARIPESDIENFYQKNTKRFQRAEVERIYIPRDRQMPPAPDSKDVGDTQNGGNGQSPDDQRKSEAEKLRARAIAGDAFSALQIEAYKVVGIKSAPPDTKFSVRRVSLPPSQVSVMDLNLGEVSPLFTEPDGYFFYKLKSKQLLPLDQEREEIKEELRSQRTKSELQRILGDTTPVFDESYFAR